MDKESPFEVFIKNLTDHELAIFIGYNFDGLMENSKNKIMNEVSKRNLTPSKLKEYLGIKLNIDSPEPLICPRCGSDRLFSETDYEERLKGRSSVEVAIETQRCRLCDFNPDKELPKNLFDRIKRIFINNKKESVIKKSSFN